MSVIDWPSGARLSVGRPKSQLSETGKQIAARTFRRTDILLGDQDNFLSFYYLILTLPGLDY